MLGIGINAFVTTPFMLFTQIDRFVLGSVLDTGLMGMVDTVDWDLSDATIGVLF